MTLLLLWIYPCISDVSFNLHMIVDLLDFEHAPALIIFLLGDFLRPRRYNWCIDLYGCLTSPLHYYMVDLVPNGLTETSVIFLFVCFLIVGLFYHVIISFFKHCFLYSFQFSHFCFTAM